MSLKDRPKYTFFFSFRADLCFSSGVLLLLPLSSLSLPSLFPLSSSVSSYVYNMRSAISSTLSEYVSNEERDAYNATLKAEEDWLYTDEGYDGDKKTFVRRFTTLREGGAMFEMRQAEHLGREECIASLKKSITKYSDIVRNVNTKDVEKVSVNW